MAMLMNTLSRGQPNMFKHKMFKFCQGKARDGRNDDYQNRDYFRVEWVHGTQGPRSHSRMAELASSVDEKQTASRNDHKKACLSSPRIIAESVAVMTATMTVVTMTMTKPRFRMMMMMTMMMMIIIVMPKQP